MPEETNELPGFADVHLSDLDAFAQAQVDRLTYGVVGLSADGIVEVYNATEAKLAGLRPDTVIGAHYFSGIAQCMNNFMVAQRFEDEAEIDDTLDYVLTLRMRPTPVRLRLLKGPACARRFILIQR